MFELHIHTTFSDGKNTPEEIIEKAIELNYSTIGISDHITASGDGVPDTDHCLGFDDFDNYFKTIRELKEKYKDKINVLVSGEMDYKTGHYMSVYNELIKYNPDYILTSVHSVSDEWTVWTVADKPQVWDDFAYQFVKKDIELVNTGTLDILGHFDIFKEHAKVNEEKLYPLYDELAEALYKNKTALELNTMNALGPCYVFNSYLFEKCKEYNIPTVVASDAHMTSQLSLNFDDAFDKIKKGGYILPPKGFIENIKK